MQLGVSIHDLDLLTIGLVMDMYAEQGNDDFYAENEEQNSTIRVADQNDFDKF